MINVPDYLAVPELLSMSRAASFWFFNYSQNYNAVCDSLINTYHGYLEAKGQSLVYSHYEFELTITEEKVQKSYEKLFGNKDDSHPTTGKQAAINYAISQFYTILQNPRFCVKYLQSLNDELKKFYKDQTNGKDFPVLDEASFEFHNIYHVSYPIPVSEDYKSELKHSWLIKYFIHYFRSKNMGQRVFKWLGFVPEGRATEMVKHGDIVLENRYYGKIIFHGRDAHVMQEFMMCRAMELGDIHVHYTIDDEPFTLQPVDIIAALVSKEKLTPNMPNTYLWDDVMDTRTRFGVNFSDPYQLTSFIMRFRHSCSLPALAGILIDDVCKSMLKLYNLYRKHNPDLGNHIEFIGKFTQLSVSEAFVPSYVIDHVILKQKQAKPLRYMGFFHNKNYEHNERSHAFYEKSVEAYYCP
jgi:hypothetical protein